MNKWISVNDRLPHAYKWVYTYRSEIEKKPHPFSQKVQIGFLDYDRDWTSVYGVVRGVTSWQEITSNVHPDPPEADNANL